MNLLPCPHCGIVPKLDPHHPLAVLMHGGGFILCRCVVVIHNGEWTYDQLMQNAIAAWNRRAQTVTGVQP